MAICTKPTIESLGTELGPVSKAKWCVHRWAYRLAPSGEPVRVVADAAIGACLDALGASQIESVKIKGEIVESLRKEYGDQWASDNYNVDTSLFTGKQIGIYEKVYEELRAEALFRVVQARSGNCSSIVE